jgi:hypothetical protein
MLIIKKIKFLSGFKMWVDGVRSKCKEVWSRGSKIVRLTSWIFLSLGVLLALSCGPSGPEVADDYLLRVGNRRVTTRDFLQALELAKTAYPDGLDPRSPVLQEISRHLLDEFTTELVVFNRAEELGISISEAELEAVISSFQSDYPQGAFEQTLVESAVPLRIWKQRMRSRLLIEKLVQLELSGRIAVLPEEVTGYYQQHYQSKAEAAEPDEQFQRRQEAIVGDMRRQKLEGLFADWIEELRARYPVHVNAQQWAQLAVSSAAETALLESN